MDSRRGAGAALALLAVLYAAAVFAPLLASDRPYRIEAVDHGSYERARAQLTAPASALVGRIAGGRAAFQAGLDPRATVRTFEAALEAERSAVRLRTATMRGYLPRGGDALLLRLEGAVDAAVALAVAGDPGAEAKAEEALALAGGAAEALRAKRGGEPLGIELVARVSYPLAASLRGLDVGLMALYLLAVTGPLWRRRLRPRGALVAGLALAAAVGAAWELGSRGGPQRTGSWKLGVAVDEVDVVSARFAPIAMGFDETHLDESFRPPTWTGVSAIDAAGYYVRGPRSPAARASGEPLPVPSPVDVRIGELPRNHPLRHVLGTDALGRDLLARMLWGGRISLAVGFVSAGLLVGIGVLVGALAGFLAGRTDHLLSRLIEVVQCFPAFFLIVTAVALVPERALHPLFTVVLVIALVGWTGVARLVRAELLRARELDYVAAARALGLGTPRIVFGHVLPNVLGPVLVAATFAVASGILIESGVSFLGFGVRHPFPSWGALLGETRSLETWWIQVFPGLVIFATVLATHLFGEGLRDALDPHAARATRAPLTEARRG